MKTYLSLLAICYSTIALSQETMKEKIPYAEIPEASEAITSGSVISRMIDGLGFRYYWATEGLTEKDLQYRPSDDGRTVGETIDHVYGLSNVILNCAKKQPNGNSKEAKELTVVEKRVSALHNFKEASAIFRTTEDLAAHTIIFQRNGKTSEFPIWNLINGPAEDALWHAGQIVVMRRAAGNPIPSGVNVFLGKRNE